MDTKAVPLRRSVWPTIRFMIVWISAWCILAYFGPPVFDSMPIVLQTAIIAAILVLGVLMGLVGLLAASIWWGVRSEKNAAASDHPRLATVDWRVEGTDATRHLGDRVGSTLHLVEHPPRLVEPLH